jgi:putative tryptophan/tyrosine transport system substrate-binding protein
MRRREFILASALAAAVPARAQEGRVPRLGIFSPTARTGGHAGIVHVPFTEALSRLGWEAGRNVEVVERFADDRYELLPALAAEIVATRPDVIFTNTVNGARAAADAASTIPIVVAPAGENIFAELARNFARPVGNVTGFTLHSQGQDEKCLEILKEAVPSAARVGILVNPLNPIWDRYPSSLSQVGKALGLDLVRMEARGGQAVRPPGAATDRVRAGDQSQDCTGPRRRRAAIAPRPRRRRDRMTLLAMQA